MTVWKTCGTAQASKRYQDDNQVLEENMLRWALIFLVVALIAAALGFGGIAGTSMDIAKILAVIFIVLFLVSLVMHAVRGRAP